VRHYVFRNQIEGVLGARVRRALEDGPARTQCPGNRPRAVRPPRAGPRPPSS
jgi:hypothetical protein